MCQFCFVNLERVACATIHTLWLNNMAAEIGNCVLGVMLINSFPEDNKSLKFTMLDGSAVFVFSSSCKSFSLIRISC